MNRRKEVDVYECNTSRHSQHGISVNMPCESASKGFFELAFAFETSTDVRAWHVVVASLASVVQLNGASRNGTPLDS